MQEFTEAAAVVVLFGYAEFLEDKCSMAARDAINAVLALKPESAVVSSNGDDRSFGHVKSYLHSSFHSHWMVPH